MPSILCRGFRYIIRHTWDLINPRAIAWRHIKKRHPHRSIITKLGKDLKVRIYPCDVIGKDIYVKRVFEKAEINFVTKFLKSGMVFFDVGANLGQYTLFAAKRIGLTGQVHSFEPNSRMFEELQFNVRLNDLTDICRLNQLALSDKNGQGLLSKYEAGAEVYGSLGNHKRSGGNITGHENVKTSTLDSYAKELRINHVDLIKMDIEGAELPALKGSVTLLSRDDGPVVLVELADINTAGFGYKAVEVWDYLENFGYQIFSLHGSKGFLKKIERPTCSTIVMNIVAIKNNKYFGEFETLCRT